MAGRWTQPQLLKQQGTGALFCRENATLHGENMRLVELVNFFPFYSL